MRNPEMNCPNCTTTLPKHREGCTWSPAHMRRCLVQTLARATPAWAGTWKAAMVKQGREKEVDQLREEVRAFKAGAA